MRISVPTSRWKTLLVLVLLALLLVSIVLLSATIMNRQEIQQSIITQVSERLQRKITFSRASVSFQPTPAFVLYDINVRERDGENTFLSADRLTFRLAIIPLLRGHVSLGTVLLEKPHINLTKDRQGKLNISDLFSENQTDSSVGIGGLKIHNGSIFYRDLTLPSATPPISIEEVQLQAVHPNRGRTSRIKLDLTLREGGKAAALSAAGSIKIAPQGKPLTDSVLDLNIAASHIDLTSLWPYYRHLVPFRQMEGNVDTTVTLKGSLHRMSISGDTSVSKGRLDFPAGFDTALSLPNFKVAYTIDASRERVNISSVHLASSIITVDGMCDISHIDTDDPHIMATATTPPFRLGPETWQLIPFPIIQVDVANFIKQHIKGGTFNLVRGRLDGDISQILHMEEKENYNVLSITAGCKDAVLGFGASIPSFNAVSGTLELQGKEFILSNMKGFFGTSPFALNGKIRDYPLRTPSSYPFSMSVTPREPEVLWLLGTPKRGDVSFSGKSSLILTGEGTSTSYSLNGKWDLTDSKYSLYDLIAKPAGHGSILTFQSVLGEDRVRIPLASLSIASTNVTADARIKYHGENPLVFTVKIPTVSLQNISAYSPPLRRFQPTGTVQGVVTGDAQTWQLSSLKLGGEALLRGVSFTPFSSRPPLSNISGSIRFRGDALETSQLSATMGTSIIHGAGSLKGFSSPEFSIAFQSPRIDPADIGIITQETKPPILRKVSGNISYSRGIALIKKLEARINDSRLAANGTIRVSSANEYDLSITSPKLSFEDLQPLMSAELADKGNQPSQTHGRLELQIESGSFDRFTFKKLKATIKQDGSVIYIDPMELNLLGGTAQGHMRVDRTLPLAPRYQAGFSVERISAEELLSTSGSSSRLLTGALSFQGDLTAKGRSQKELRSSLLGNVKIHFDEGVLKKFPVLAKIFSILNVSQLFKLQLPDMAKSGMPYNSITASLAVKDGIVSTSDLKIDSNAMNISAIGTINLPNEELNLTIGVKPLQTVDKVVSKIPLIGWVLTGKDKTLLTAWFEAKGTWDEPQVNAIPISSLSRGVLGIFRRLMELPGKLFTNTGEVILGN